jgi:hypothetical protein
MMWQSYGNARGAAIGALIGGGIGIAAAIKVNRDNRIKAYAASFLIFGGLGALIAGAAGASWTSHTWRTHRPWQDEYEYEDERASNSNPAKPRETQAILESQEPPAPPAASQLKTAPDYQW